MISSSSSAASMSSSVTITSRLSGISGYCTRLSPALRVLAGLNQPLGCEIRSLGTVRLTTARFNAYLITLTSWNDAWSVTLNDYSS